MAMKMRLKLKNRSHGYDKSGISQDMDTNTLYMKCVSVYNVHMHQATPKATFEVHEKINGKVMQII